ncbi:unnamed protein product, partial [Larinioides sclopetarius]
ASCLETLEGLKIFAEYIVKLRRLRNLDIEVLNFCLFSLKVKGVDQNTVDEALDGNEACGGLSKLCVPMVSR